MTGLIWFVQVVHYPLFDRVGTEASPRYAVDHQRRTMLVVMPVMLIEALTATALVWLLPTSFQTAAWSGMAMLVAIWLSTAFVQVPRHAKRGSDLTRGLPAPWSPATGYGRFSGPLAASSPCGSCPLSSSQPIELRAARRSRHTPLSEKCRRCLPNLPAVMKPTDLSKAALGKPPSKPARRTRQPAPRDQSSCAAWSSFGFQSGPDDKPAPCLKAITASAIATILKETLMAD